MDVFTGKGAGSFLSAFQRPLRYARRPQTLKGGFEDVQTGPATMLFQAISHRFFRNGAASRRFSHSAANIANAAFCLW